MPESKKFYWLKLDRGFFKKHNTKIIEAMPNGKDYVLFYLKLLVESIDHIGNLRFSDTIPYNESMLATITDTNIDIVRTAMKILHDLDMIEIMDDQTIFMNELEKMIGSETEWAQQKRLYREKQCKVGQCPDDVRQLSDKSIEKDIDIDTESIESTPETGAPPRPKKHQYGQYSNVLLTDDEYSRLQKDFPDEFDALINRLSQQIEMKGYKAKNHNLALRGWVKDALKEYRIRQAEMKQREDRLTNGSGNRYKKAESESTFNADEFLDWSFKQIYGDKKQ